ncbi:MAG: PAS domain-containing protein [Actinomycetota bacterium]
MSAEGSGVPEAGSEIPEDLYRQVVEAVPAVTYVFGRSDQRFLYVSPQSEAVLGLTPADMMVDGAERVRMFHPDDRGRILQAMAELEETGSWDTEYRLLLPDGSTRWVHDRARSVPATGDRPAMWFGVITPLDKDDEVDSSLVDAETRYQALVEQLPAVVYIDSFEERPITLYVSRQIEKLTGYRPEEWISDPGLWIRVIHPDDGAIMRPDWPLHLDGAEEAASEYRLLHRDGHVLQVRDVARLVRAVDGTPLFWQGVMLDVTEQNRVEDERVRSEARYRALVEQVPGIVYIDTNEPDPAPMYVSPQVLQLTGYSVEEWMADRALWLKATHPDDRERVREEWLSAVGRRAPFSIEYRTVHRDGRVSWFHDTARLVHSAEGKPLFWQGLIQDVTEAKRAEVMVEESELRHRKLVEQVPAVVFIDSHEESPTCYYVSPQSTEMLGYTPQEFQDDPTLFFRIMHPDDVDRVGDAWVDAVRHRDSFFCDFRLIRRDGAFVSVREAAVLIRDVDGNPAYWQGLIQDLTDRKRAEDGLRASEARYRMLVEQVPAVVYEMDPDDERRTLFVNPQVEALFGYSREEWLDQPDIWIELLHPDDREIELAAHDLHNETGEPWSQEYRLIANDGRVVWVRDQARLVRDEAGNASTWQGIMLDITGQKDMEERLRQSNDDLEFRVLERTAELEEANEMMTLEIGERKRIETELLGAHERYRRLVEDLPAVVYLWHVHDPENTGQHYTSPHIEKLLGYSAEEWNTSDVWIERLHPHDRERVLAASARSETTGEPFSEEYRVFAKDGRLVVVFDHATLLSRDQRGQPFLFQGVLMDMTDRHRAEEHAARAAQRYREIAEDGPVVFMVLEYAADLEQRFRLRYLSPQIQDILGYPAARFYADPWSMLDIVHPDDIASAEELSQRIMDGHPWDLDYRMIADDGRVRWIHLEGRTMERDDEGRPRRLQGIMMDVTTRKENEERASEEASQLRSLVEQMPGVPWTYAVDDPADWRPIYIAPQVGQLLGYTAEELMAEPRFFQRLVYPDDLAGILALAARRIRRGEPWTAEFRIVARDGRVLWLRSRGNPGRDDQGRPVLHGIWLDITAEREREDSASGGSTERRER